MSLDSKMTALADEIRELSGTTTAKSIDAMTSDVSAANTEIAEQSELLEQIATALDGKAGGSGGNVSYNTCTVNISTDGDLNIRKVAYTTVNNGETEGILLDVNAPSHSLVCLCDSVVVVEPPRAPMRYEVIKAINLGLIDVKSMAFKITAAKNETATITAIFGGGGV